MGGVGNFNDQNFYIRRRYPSKLTYFFPIMAADFLVAHKANPAAVVHKYVN
jgi:hypothetical protein